ncbi:outer dynein arm-docking complex subunit 1 [Onthophagus taurus]|uniref:outer dynein arm-docking complex subunit 1 n=1 Tax=Onthophagus taurus TaxID=166361 RepID=UPI0039BE81E2
MAKHIRKQISAQEQLEMDIMAEAELARLQRQYRIMDGDRKAFEDEATTKLKKQRKVIELLSSDYKDLEENLRVATANFHKRKDATYSLEIQRLLEKHNRCEEMIKKETRQLKEIEHQINKVKQDVLEGRKTQETEKQVQEKWIIGQKNVATLQNKLDTSVKRFCKILAENKSLRDEIDHLLIERSLFNKSWQSLLTELNNGKKIMMDLIEQGTTAYDQREESGQKLQALKIRAQNDLLLHMSDMRELFRQLDHDANLQDFLSVKGQRRILKDLEMKEFLKKQQIRENQERQLFHYKQTLMKVQELAGENDVNKLAAEYVKQEEENFALFNYVNELNHELESLSDNIRKLSVSIEEQIEFNEVRAQEQQDTIDALSKEYLRIKKELEEEREKLESKENELKEVFGEIENILDVIKCDSTPILDLLGQREGINNHNIHLYLGLVENKIGELLKQTNK